MELVNSILNIAGLLLWLNWRAGRFNPISRAKTSMLAGTLKPASSTARSHWLFLAAVVVLLAVRPLGYRLIGPALDWMPVLDFGPTALPFRSDHLVRLFLFSVLSFGWLLGIFYAALVLLAIVNRRIGESDPCQRLVRLYLGRAARLPLPLLPLLMLAIAVAAWMAIHPALVLVGLLPSEPRWSHVVVQGLLVTARMLLSLRYLIAAFLLAHLFSSYVYLGERPMLSYINATGRNLLRPLRWLPLRLGKVDFAPVVEIMLVFAATELCLSIVAGQRTAAFRWLIRVLGVASG